MRALVLAPCPFAADPRHEYWVESLERWGFATTRAEVIDSTANTLIALQLTRQIDVLSAGSNRHSSLTDGWLSDLAAVTSSPLGRMLLGRLRRQVEAGRLLAAHYPSPDLIVANDLFGALIACLCWSSTEVTVIYDAQELFTDSFEMLEGPKFTAAEKSAWISVETDVCRRVAGTVTVSEGISCIYAERHGADCFVVPNFVPREDHVDYPPSGGPRRFVFIGRPDPHRGLEKLVRAWDFPPEEATLDLYLTGGLQTKALMRLSGTRIRRFSGPVFRKPVSPDEIVKTLAAYDVGVVPYEYPYPYTHASPNKLGEYLAAGLALIANDQEFSGNLVKTRGLGRVFDWRRRGSFENAVREMSMPNVFLESRESVRAARESEVNWDEAVEELRAFLTSLRWTRFQGQIRQDPMNVVSVRATYREVLESFVRRSALVVVAKGYRIYVSLLSWRRIRSD